MISELTRNIVSHFSNVAFEVVRAISDIFKSDDQPAVPSSSKDVAPARSSSGPPLSGGVLPRAGSHEVSAILPLISRIFVAIRDVFERVQLPPAPS